MTAKQDAEKLMNFLVPFAKKMLIEHGELWPFGGYIKPSGEIVSVAVEVPQAGIEKPRQMIESLEEQFRGKARRNELSVSGIVFDVRVKPPQEEDKCDAIQINLEHEGGYSATVFHTYCTNAGDIYFNKVFAQPGPNTVFEKPSR